VSVTKSLIKNAVLCGNQTPRREFKKRFTSEIDIFITDIYEAYNLFDTIPIEIDKRPAYVKGYFYKATQDLISAFNIFISGYIVPPGNLMRQFFESVAMAILLSCPTLKYFEKFCKDYKTFPINKVFSYIDNNIDHFEINPEAWKSLVKIKDCYHAFSHSTLFAMSTGAVIGSAESMVILGSYFDSGKMKHYTLEIKRMISAAQSLKNIIIGVKKQLNVMK